MFLNLSVSHSVHRTGCLPLGRGGGVHTPPRHTVPGHTHPWTHTSLDTHTPPRHTPPPWHPLDTPPWTHKSWTHTHPWTHTFLTHTPLDSNVSGHTPRHTHSCTPWSTSGRYTSYWNAFLFTHIFVLKIKFKTYGTSFAGAVERFFRVTHRSRDLLCIASRSFRTSSSYLSMTSGNRCDRNVLQSGLPHQASPEFQNTCCQ